MQCSLREAVLAQCEDSVRDDDLSEGSICEPWMRFFGFPIASVSISVTMHCNAVIVRFLCFVDFFFLLGDKLQER